MLVKLQEIAPEGFEVSFSLEGEALSRALEVVETAAMQCKGKLLRREDQISLLGSYQAQVSFTCDRCLGPGKRDLQGSFRLELFPVSHDAHLPREMEVPLDQPETDIYEGSSLTLDPYFEDQLILDLGIQNLCDPECKGLCAHCGCDLNQSSCDCASQEHTSPFAVIKGQIHPKTTKE